MRTITITAPGPQGIQGEAGAQGPPGVIPNTGSFATTGSNNFNGNQTITGSLIQGLEGNIATGENSHAEGSITKAIGNYSHAEGDYTQAKGDYSHAEGQETIASGSYSHAEGYQTIALANHQHVQGQWNAASSVPAAFIVGNGTDGNNRSNLIHAAGNEVQITGSLTVSGATTMSSALVSGNVTVLGTASINVLQINTTINSTGSNQFGDAANDTQTLYGTVRIPTGSLTVSGSVSFGTSSAGFFWDNTNARLGIGTATPAYSISHLGTIGVASFFTQRDFGFNAFAQIATRSHYIAYTTDGNNGIAFGANGSGGNIQGFTGTVASPSAKALILQQLGGNLLIGTTTDSGFKLDVSGSTRLNGNTQITGSLDVSSTARFNNTFNLFRSDGTQMLNVSDSGAAIDFNPNNSSAPTFRVRGNATTVLLHIKASEDRIGIGTLGPDASAMLDITSTNKGFLPPRTNTTASITSPAQGLITYLTGSTNEGLYYYNSGSQPGWHKVLTNTGSQSITGSLSISGVTTFAQASSINGSGNLAIGAFSVHSSYGFATFSATTLLLTGGTFTSTTGNQVGLSFGGGFTPTSGTATYTAYSILPTISQSSAATGITRGLYVNPTLTSAANFRAIETTSGSVLFSHGASTLLFASSSGFVGVGTNTPAYTLDVNGTIRSQGQLIVVGQIQNPTIGVVDVNGVLYSGTGVSVGVNSTNAAKLLVRGSGATNATTAFRVENTNTSASLVVLDNGYVGINTGSAQYNLDVNGTVRTGVLTCGNINPSATTNVSGVTIYTGTMDVGTNNDLRLIVPTAAKGVIVSQDYSFLSSGSALLEVKSTTKGFLPPRMTNAQRTSISAPAVGLMVYCTDATEGLYIYKSTGWTFIM